MALQAFSLPQICAPVPADLNLPGSKKPPGGAFFWFVPPASPRQPFPNPCRRAAHQSSSLFPLHSPHSGLSLPLLGSARELPSAGAEDQFPGGNAGLQNALSPRTAPHARHRLILNPCRRAAHRNYSLFPIHYSLFTCPARRHTAPRQTRPLPGNARELLPAGALSPPGHGPCPGCVRVSLACPQILSANCSPQGLPYFMGI